MAARFLAETRTPAGDLRSLRRWTRGWRLAALAAVGAGAAAGIAVASIWMSSGHVIILLVIAGPCILAGLFWSLFSVRGRDKAASEPMGNSDWEARIRPRFPRDEGPETDITRQREGGEP
jgi:hypothetical protein